MPVSRQRTPRTEAMAGQPQVGLFVLSLSVSQYVSNYRDIAAKSHHAGFNILTWECKNIQKCMYNDACTGANVLKHLGMLILFCLLYVQKFCCLHCHILCGWPIYLFYILLVSSHDWIIYLSSTEKGKVSFRFGITWGWVNDDRMFPMIFLSRLYQWHH